MGIKKWFTVPDGEKVTDKALRRVLISSICSILLCMTCLVSTTWAWFTLELNNEGNIIQIATVIADVSISPVDHENNPIKNSDGSYQLAKGKYTVTVIVDDNADAKDALGDKRPVYVSMTVSGTETENYYFQFGGSGSQTVNFAVTEDSMTVSFCAASWVKPENAAPVGTDAITAGEIPEESTYTQTTETTTMPTSEPTAEPSSESTEPAAEATTEPTSASSEPTAEAATESTSEPTVPATETTEPSTEVTAAHTIESTSTSEPATEATVTPTGAPSDVHGDDRGTGETVSTTASTEAATE